MPNIRNRFEDPDVFDSRGILKDGAVARVRMSMRDAADDGPLDPGELAHRLQMLDAERRRQGPVVTDAAGDSLFGLRKPGFRYLTGGSHRDQRDRERLHDARRQAHIDYVRDLEGSWRTPASTVGAHANSSPAEGDLCTTSGGFSGTWQTNEDGELVCLADPRTNGDSAGKTLQQLQLDHASVMEAAYAAHDEWLRNQWKTK